VGLTAFGAVKSGLLRIPGGSYTVVVVVDDEPVVVVVCPCFFVVVVVVVEATGFTESASPVWIVTVAPGVTS
jgi:hypothetical protein